MGEIVPALKVHLYDILQNGHCRTDVSKEVNSSTIQVLWVSGVNIGEEISEVVSFYGKEFDEKHREEEEHYKFLTHGMLHKINATKYFHGQGLESRKNILFSDDCISSIHLLVRPEAVRLNVYMRSSDVMRLLPVDVLAMATLLDTIIKKHKIELYDGVVILDITIGSAHIVTNSDLEKAMSIVNR